MEAPFDIEFEGFLATVREYYLQEMRVFHNVYRKAQAAGLYGRGRACRQKMVDVGAAGTSKRSRRSWQADCTITKEYLQRFANPTEYPTLPGIDMSYMDTAEELLYPAA